MIYKNLSLFEKDMLLAFFQQHMTVEQRQELMHAMPEAYNNLIGRRIMESVHVEEDDL